MRPLRHPRRRPPAGHLDLLRGERHAPVLLRRLLPGEPQSDRGPAGLFLVVKRAAAGRLICRPVPVHLDDAQPVQVRLPPARATTHPAPDTWPYLGRGPEHRPVAADEQRSHVAGQDAEAVDERTGRGRRSGSQRVVQSCYAPVASWTTAPTRSAGSLVTVLFPAPMSAADPADMGEPSGQVAVGAHASAAASSCVGSSSGTNPGSHSCSSSRSRTVAPNWHSTPIVLRVTRWISR